MPRLGEDPNVTTAYPNRHPLSRRGFLRQLVTTLLGSLLIFLVFNNLFLTDYKKKARDSMVKSGFKEEIIASVIPKTRKEKKLEMDIKKANDMGKIANLEHAVGNLTYSVLELQQALKNSTGATLRFPVNATLPDEGVADGAPVVEEKNHDHGGSARRRRQLRG